MLHLELSFYNATVKFLFVGVVERKLAREHFIEKDAQAPVVDTFVVPDSQQDFRREVLRSPTKRVSFEVLRCEKFFT